MRTNSFKVVLEPTATAGMPIVRPWYGKALRNIHDVIQMVVRSLVEHGEAVPEEPADEVRVFAEPQVAVIV